MSTPGKMTRAQRLTGPSASGAVEGPTPGRVGNALTDRLSRRMEEPEPATADDVVGTIGTAACLDDEQSEECGLMTDGQRSLLMIWTMTRANIAATRWHSAIDRAHTSALLNDKASVPAWLEALTSVLMIGLPTAIAKGAEALVKLRLSYRALNMLDKVAAAETRIAASVSMLGMLKSQVLSAVVGDDNPKAALLAALRDIPGAWVGMLFRDALVMSDAERIVLCGALDEGVLTSQLYDQAVDDTVKRFAEQVDAVGPNRIGGTHAAYLMNARGQMRMAVVTFDQMRHERLLNREHQIAGNNRYTFVRFIDEDMEPAALTRQVKNTAPPVLRLSDPDVPLMNPDAPELKQWTEETAPQFQPQYIGAP